jgi:transcriptional regulator with XRE-family HTH domain
MTARSRPGDAAALEAKRLAGTLGTELRNARTAAGLSLDAVARAAGMSAAQLSRIERAANAQPTLEQLWRAAAPLGLRGFANLYPAGSPVRDAGSLALFARVEAVLSTPLRLLREVPIPLDGDLRAWDGMLVCGHDRCFLECETHLSDIQAMERRLRAKLRDDGRSDVLVLVVMRSAHNRRVLRDHREVLRDLLPLNGADVLRSLRAGRIPPAGGLVML